MSRRIALIAAATVVIGAAAPPKAPSWRIVRHDYVEFCAGRTIVWDLRSGLVTVTSGACDPRSTGPAAVSATPLAANDLDRLRALTRKAMRRGLSVEPCGAIDARALPGPIGFEIVAFGRLIRSSSCPNGISRTLQAAMAASLDRARS